MMQRILLLICVFFPVTVFAYYGQDVPSIDHALQGLIILLTTSIAKLVGILAIVSIGYMTIANGAIPKKYAFSVIIGLGIIFGAPAIFHALGFSTMSTESLYYS